MGLWRNSCGIQQTPYDRAQVQFPWRRAVDGLYLDYDRLFGAGIDVREGARGKHRLAQNEKVQLLNLLDEQMESLKLGFLD